MAGRLAIDFGTSNTRAAVWDPLLEKARPLSIPDVSLMARVTESDDRVVEVPYVPSLVSYSDKSVWIGRQVRDRGLADSPNTFRWMKRYISNRLEIPRKIGDRSIRISDAAKDFLVRALVYAAEAVDLRDEEVALTVPVEAFEHYQEWLMGVCEAAGVTRPRLLDEASAAALGYGVRLGPDAAYMVFDFGGGTLDVSIVKIEKEGNAGKRCSSLGKAGAEVGGASVDQWMYKDLLARNGKKPEDVRHISGLLIMEVERAKEALTSAEKVEIAVADPRTGEVIFAAYSRSSFEDLLEENGLFETIQRTVNRAMSAAGERGYGPENIEAALLVGGSSLIPSVRRSVRQMFGAKVKSHRPLDAVALGAAAFVGGVSFYDHIQHDYALRYYNREKGEHDYLKIVPAGAPYPSEGAICRVTVSGSYDDQEHLGLEIYEIGSKECFAPGDGPVWDLVFDPGGAARFQRRESRESLSRFWINEGKPTFIHASPRASRGDKRFPVEFSIDAAKRLCVTVKDLRTGANLLRDHPVVKLT